MAEFKRLGVQVVGVSTDPIDLLAKFQKDENAPQRFVSDASGTGAKAFGIDFSLQGQTLAKRATFIIGAGGKVLYSALDPSPLTNVNNTLGWLKAHPQ